MTMVWLGGRTGLNLYTVGSTVLCSMCPVDSFLKGQGDRDQSPLSSLPVPTRTPPLPTCPYFPILLNTCP